MLGWFKKKFRKTPSPVEESLEAREETGATAPPDEPLIEAEGGQERARDTVASTGGTPESVVEGMPGEVDREETDTADHGAGEGPDGEKERPRPSSETAPEPKEKVPPEHDHAETVPAPTVSRKQEQAKPGSLFKRLRDRLGKTRNTLVHRLDTLFRGRKEIDEELFEELEEILITADLGVSTVQHLLDEARRRVRRDQLDDPAVLKDIIRDQLLAYLQESDRPAELVMPEKGPFVIMVVGVNGVGKTTTIGKIGAKFLRSGQSVLLVAADTFRAAAIDQLKIWGERIGAPVISRDPGADPSSVVFDGLEYGLAHDYEVIIIDTAGRLHTSVNLMEELKKIKRVMNKKLPGAPHEIMLVIDATTGQNGVSQARLFNEAVGITGLALTKLDGTAKGGIVVHICHDRKIPVRFIGIGEQVDDLRDFDAREFVDALFDQQEEDAA